MRKLSIAAVSIGSALCLTACVSTTSTSNEGDAPGAAQNTKGAASHASKKPIMFGDTVRVTTSDGNVFRATVGKPKPHKAGPLGPPSGHKKIIAVRVTLVGLKGKTDFNPLYFKAQDSQGDSFDPGLGDTNGQLDAGTLGPGDKQRGLVAFEVPKHKKITVVKLTGPLLDSQAEWH